MAPRKTSTTRSTRTRKTADPAPPVEDVEVVSETPEPDMAREVDYHRSDDPRDYYEEDHRPSRSPVSLTGCLVIVILFLIFMLILAIGGGFAAYYYLGSDSGGGGDDRTPAALAREIDAVMNSETEDVDAFYLGVGFKAAADSMRTDGGRAQPVYDTKEELLAMVYNFGKTSVEGSSADQYPGLPAIIQRELEATLPKEAGEVTPEIRNSFIKMLEDLSSAFLQVSDL